MLPAWDNEREKRAKEILYRCMEELQATKAALYLEGSEGAFELAASYGFGRRDALAPSLPLGHPLMDWARRNRTGPAYLNAPQEFPALGPLLESALTSRLMTIPLAVAGRMVGLVDARDKSRRAAYGPGDVVVGRSIGHALERFIAELGGSPPLAEAPAQPPGPARATMEVAALSHRRIIEDLTGLVRSLARLPEFAAAVLTITDGRSARARTIGTDPESDIAVLKIDLDKLPVIAFGDVDRLQVGDVVLAIGNPFGVGQTVTSGIVSALGRNSLGVNTFENFIQTDAAINPGNSGGALVDTNGNLLGINTAIFSRSGGSLGIGFAIPVSTARQVMESLIKDGQVIRGWIGVEPRDLTPEIAKTLDLSVTQGVLIAGVVQSGPASAGGLRPGDVVLKIAGKPVANTPQLLNAVAALKPRETTTISVQRGDSPLEVKVTVAQRPRLRRSNAEPE